MKLKFLFKNLIFFTFIFFSFYFLGNTSPVYAWVPGGVRGAIYMRDLDGNLIPLSGAKINREDWWTFSYCPAGESCWGTNDTVETASQANGSYVMNNSENDPGPVIISDPECPSPTEAGAYRCPTGLLGDVRADLPACALNWCGLNCGSNPHRWKAYFPSGYTLPGGYSTTTGHWETTDPRSEEEGGCGHSNESWGSYSPNAYYQLGIANYEERSGCNFVWVPELVTPEVEIGNMEVTTGASACPGCREKFSGLQAGELGASWYNFMTISQTVAETGGVAGDISLVVVGFVPNQATNSGELTSQGNNGLVLAYAQREDNGLGLSAGNYYLYYNGWQQIGRPTDRSPVVYFCIDKYGNTANGACDLLAGTGKIQIRIQNRPEYLSNPSPNSLKVGWDVYLWKVFGSKSFYTYAYGRDRDGREAFAETLRGAAIEPLQLLAPPRSLLAFFNNFFFRLRSLVLAKF